MRKIIIDEIEANLTGDKIEQSDAGMKNNPDLIQEVEVENADADLTEDASKINIENKNINISVEEEQETVKYQNTLKVDV